jgi:hypothetical protein
MDVNEDERSFASQSSVSKEKAIRGGRKKPVIQTHSDDEDDSRSHIKSTLRGRIVESDDDIMEVDEVPSVQKKPVARRRAPAAPASSTVKNSVVSQSLSKNTWGNLSDEDDIVEAAPTKAIPKKRTAPAQSAMTAKRTPLSQGLKQTSILTFSQSQSNTSAKTSAAKPLGKGSRRNPF